MEEGNGKSVYSNIQTFEHFLTPNSLTLNSITLNSITPPLLILSFELLRNRQIFDTISVKKEMVQK